ncbi:MAG: NapC/NirT family cytochrome c [bacterium]|nr:NapC/NirT family cytochrome c [Gemmatimonadota bacterium]
MSRGRTLLDFIRTISLDPIGATGVLMATFGGGLFLLFLILSLSGFPFSPYIGIFIYIILPAILLLGLVLIPIGRWRIGRKYPGERPPLFDLTNPAHQKKLGIVAGLTVVNVLLFGAAAYEAYHLSDSDEFCGTVCHKVMEPEWTAYQTSPHSRVGCVACHIGPGAGWFVRSKLSGARQVLAVTFNTYSHPIETPVRNLRPARETCEQCHWPEKFHGDRVDVRHRFQEDEENTDTVTVLALHIGGGNRKGKPVSGIHWHTNPANVVSYVSTDFSREEIPWVKLETADGNVVEFVSEDCDDVDQVLATGTHRTMDCMDCHNRPTHIYEEPDRAVDLALTDGRLDKGMKWIRREGVRALRTPVAEGEDPYTKIRAALGQAYAKREPGLVTEAQLDDASKALTKIWSRNVFPHMAVTWGTYPTFLGHQDDGGCFRCHDGLHVAEGGRTIPDDCETCHALLAEEEQNPEILELISGTN